MMRRVRRRLLTDDRGMVTVEAAFALAAIVAMVVIGVVAVAAVAAHVRCIDAAREAARIAAQGDSVRAEQVARQVGPDGASVRIRTEGELIVAQVRVDVPLLPGVEVGARAVAAVEPGGDE
ncbi:TadE family type IV pilus minor pilin [Williamsia soli]|uniref:TadE family type IV pilus minor pilin n=1 Tax=Williamsia soli TaxID=364929 RepID=UPI001F1E94A5|nr:TadE family type IV pilus minor pilin [Williamsia soli]